jgi:uncharacterized protein (DUF1800 family)
VQNDGDDAYLEGSFWQQAIAGSDQLRQRVKYALTEQMVVSSQDFALAEMPRGTANYYDVLGADAFGNFRQLLEDATRDPDENFWQDGDGKLRMLFHVKQEVMNR